MGLSVKQWRLAKGISQTEMAMKCGVHRNTYAAWEENPDDISVGNAKIIAKALGESVDTIFFKNEWLLKLCGGCHILWFVASTLNCL